MTLARVKFMFSAILSLYSIRYFPKVWKMDLLKVFVIFSSLCVISLEAKSRAVAKPATQLSSSGENNKFIEDPFVFYKWPGFARAEGLYGKWPWYPAFIIDKSKEDSEEEAADDEVQNEAKDEEEDDEVIFIVKLSQHKTVNCVYVVKT
jgi:hypothetical protein